MRRALRYLIVCLIMVISLSIIGSTALAQTGYPFIPILWEPFQSQPLHVPTWRDPFYGQGDLLVDNFEYWDSPYNHGWMQQEPPYPVYGFGIGYATIFNTVLDLQQGSRVLDVYRPTKLYAE